MTIVLQRMSAMAIEAARVEASAPVQLIALGGGCKFITGDPRHGPWQYCGQPTTDAASAWCPDHRAKVYLTNATARLERLTGII